MKRDKTASLTTKQRKLVKGLTEGKTQRQAALDAGYSPKNADSIASREVKKSQVQASLSELMAVSGLSDDTLLKKHVQLLNAQKINGSGGDEKSKPDYSVQVKALELAYKLKGAFVEKQEVKHSGALEIRKIERVVVKPQR